MTVMVNLANVETREREARTIELGRAVAELSSKQHGVIARAQMTMLGIDRGAIDWRLKSGRLRTTHRGVYAVGHGPLSQRGQWMAAVLAYGKGALLSHSGAGALWGLMRPRGPVDVTSPRGREREGIRFHRTRIDAEERRVIDNIPVTSVARTLFDLAEVLDESRLERVWEEADRLNLLQMRELEKVCRRNPGRRALRPIRHLLVKAHAPVTTRSALEDRFAAFCRDHHLPPPVTNVEILGCEVDVLWPKQRLIAELDGWEFHGHRGAFNRDHARDSARLVAGYRTIHVTHHRLAHEAATLLAELRSLLGIA